MSIDYTLAKELKEAGYKEPQDGLSYFSVAELTLAGIPLDENAYIPTLSELIEACGEDFYRLTYRKDDTPPIFNPEHWSAMPKTSAHCGKGKTPEEAVAKLWLALNK